MPASRGRKKAKKPTKSNIKRRKPKKKIDESEEKKYPDGYIESNDDTDDDDIQETMSDQDSEGETDIETDVDDDEIDDDENDDDENDDDENDDDENDDDDGNENNDNENNAPECNKYRPVIRREIVEVSPDKRLTSSIMTKYEYAYIIGTRAKEIEQGGPCFIDVGTTTDFIKMAKKELRGKKCPLDIIRMIRPGVVERWHANEMGIPFK